VKSSNHTHSKKVFVVAVPGNDIAALSNRKIGRGGDKGDSNQKQEVAVGLVSGVQNCSPGFAIDSGRVGLKGCMKRVISFPASLKTSNFEFSASFKGVEGSSAKVARL
jgi:hypothetical protein